MIILQVNLQKSRAGFDLILKAAEDLGASVILASEPNIAKARKSKWYSNPRCNCALKVMKSNPFKSQIPTSGECFVRLDTEDITFYSVYLSYNDSRDTFERELLQLYNDIDSLINTKPNRAIMIGGDFNSKSAMWNSPTEDPRGRILSEWFASLELTILNRGSTPTFIRGESSSFIDITVCTENLSTSVKRWEVLLEENLSDHNSIVVEIDINSSTSTLPEQYPARGWRLQKDKVEPLKNRITEVMGQVDHTPSEAVKAIKSICDQVLPRRGASSKRRPVYWWNGEIDDIRKQCFYARRKLVRRNGSRNRTAEEIEALKKEYYSKKKHLRKAILQSQSRSWNKLCEDLNENIWGTGYKIVCKKFKALTTNKLTTQEKLEIADKLFPQHPLIDWQLDTVEPDDIPLFTMDELLQVCLEIPRGKAPGPDNISPEIIREFILTTPDFFLKVLNDQLKLSTFPDIWKRASLVLIQKEMKPSDVGKSYRPICLLDILGKVLEKLIKLRLELEINRSGGLSPLQFGFTSGKSTIDAMLEVKKIADDAKKRKKLCVLTMVDVKNAFNSTPWAGIIAELKSKNIPSYLVNMLSSYFHDRSIIIDNSKKETSCGVPQGSVLGAVLWNIYYDPILRVKLPQNTSCIAYADDLVLLTTGTIKDTLEMEISVALSKVNNWMRAKQLELAPQKTEVVMLVSSRAVNEITVEVAGVQTKSKASAKYLGVIFDQNMKMTTHIRNVSEKAEKVATNLGRLMPNVRGPKNCKRKLLGAVVYSTLFYAIPAWVDVLRFKKYRNRIEKVQRKVMLRQCRSYRTTSTVALQIISGSLPIELMAEERTELYKARKTGNNISEFKEILRESLLQKWQEKWNLETQKGQWTKELIRNIEPWVIRSYGEVNYELCQFLTGHGNFADYLHRMGISSSNTCRYCSEIDTPKHMVFHCPRWGSRREKCWSEIGAVPTPNNIVGQMMCSQKKWDTISSYITELFQAKNADIQRTLTSSEAGRNNLS